MSRHRGQLAALGILLGVSLMLPVLGCGSPTVTGDGWPVRADEMNAAPGFNDTERLDAYLNERLTAVCLTRRGAVPESAAISDMAFEGTHLRILLDLPDDQTGRRAALDLRSAVLDWSGSWSYLEVWSGDGSVLATATR